MFCDNTGVQINLILITWLLVMTTLLDCHVMSWKKLSVSVSIVPLAPGRWRSHVSRWLWRCL